VLSNTDLSIVDSTTFGAQQTNVSMARIPNGTGPFVEDTTPTPGVNNEDELLQAMVISIDLVSATTARLSWDAVTQATEYDIYRGTTAYFEAGGTPWQTISAPGTEYDFTDGIGDDSVTYFFKGKARSATQTSPPSNCVGEYERDLGAL
jgi:hypothetical protein